MAFTGSYICTSFYTNILNGVINLSTDTLRLALYTSSASLTAATTAYSATNELATALGYTGGGVAVVATLTSTTTASGAPCVLVDFTDGVWSPATFTARGGLLYSDTAAGNPAIAVLDFGEDKTGNGFTPFTVVMPSNTPGTALLTMTTVLQAAG